MQGFNNPSYPHHNKRALKAQLVTRQEPSLLFNHSGQVRRSICEQIGSPYASRPCHRHRFSHSLDCAPPPKRHFYFPQANLIPRAPIILPLPRARTRRRRSSSIPIRHLRGIRVEPVRLALRRITPQSRRRASLIRGAVILLVARWRRG